MSMLVIMLLLSSRSSDALLVNASTKLTVKDAPVASRSPYRVDDDAQNGPTAKDRAFSEIGQQCQVVGARMCTSNGRKILTATLGN